jgi:hypothetical protein
VTASSTLPDSARPPRVDRAATSRRPERGRSKVLPFPCAVPAPAPETLSESPVSFGRVLSLFVLRRRGLLHAVQAQERVELQQRSGASCRAAWHADGCAQRQRAILRRASCDRLVPSSLYSASDSLCPRLWPSEVKRSVLPSGKRVARLARPLSCPEPLRAAPVGTAAGRRAEPSAARGGAARFAETRANAPRASVPVP